MAFSENCGYSLILYQNLTLMVCFLRVSCDVESELTLVNCSYSVIIKSVDPSCNSNGYFTLGDVCNMYWLVIWKILVC